MFRKVRSFYKNNKIISFLLSFLAIVLVVYLSIEFYLNDCNTSSLHAYVPDPQGKMIQKYNNDINFKTFGELTTHCKNEAFNSSCYNVKEKGETVYRQMQLGLIRILFIVDQICRKHNIKYWIMKGTLIGAYRGNKMVPWDDDADVSFLPEDYERFEKIIRTILPKDISFQSKEEDVVNKLHRRVPHAKIRDEKSCYGHCILRRCLEKDGAQLDIIIMRYFDEGNNRGAYLYDETNLIVKKQPDPNYNIPWNFVSPIIDVDFEDIKLKAPRKMLEVLYFSYEAPWLKPFDPCPGKMIPIPWYSCEEIQKMDSTKKNKLWNAMRL